VVDRLVDVDGAGAVVLQEHRGADGEVRVRAVADDGRKARAEHRQQRDHRDQQGDVERHEQRAPGGRAGGRRARRQQPRVAPPGPHRERRAAREDERERERERHAGVDEDRQLQRRRDRADRQHPQQLEAAQAHGQQQPGGPQAGEAEHEHGCRPGAQDVRQAALADDARVARQRDRRHARGGQGHPGEHAVGVLRQPRRPVGRRVVAATAAALARRLPGGRLGGVALEVVERAVVGLHVHRLHCRGPAPWRVPRSSAQDVTLVRRARSRPGPLPP
jgi:hypothetical protein